MNLWNGVCQDAPGSDRMAKVLLLMQIELPSTSSDLQSFVNSWHLESMPGGFRAVEIRGQNVFITRSFWTKAKISSIPGGGTLFLKSSASTTRGALAVIVLGVFLFLLPAIIIIIVCRAKGAELGEEVLRFVQQQRAALRETSGAQPVVPPTSTPSIALCPGCRATISMDYLFCGKCGIDLWPKAPAPAAATPQGAASTTLDVLSLNQQLAQLQNRSLNLDLKEAESRLRASFAQEARKLIAEKEGLLESRESYMTELNKKVLQKRELTHETQVYAIAWSLDGTRLASGSHDEIVRIWDAETGSLSKALVGHHGFVPSVCWSPDSTRVASGSSDKTIRIWDVSAGVFLAILRGHTDHVLSVSWSPDGAHLASSSCDNTIRIWDTSTGVLLRTLLGHADRVRSVAWSPDSSMLVSGSVDRTIRIWDCSTGALLRTLRGHGDVVNSVCWSPNGSRIVSGSSDNAVRIWDASSGALIQTLEGHKSDVFAVAWSPDGARLASGSADRTIRVWDASTGSFLWTITQTDFVRSVSWRPNGAQLASGSDDKILRVWEAPISPV